ncbi:protein fmp25 [Anaeramoeba ignava]|uniref:Protein fmp25 n=1 Tax=Anaeramoeba ignava TaxID=1746090 RepID=A0A9Q0RIP1_ANAIG|nr:protein fmp25 [Anaeramoeba ignava]
MWKCSFNNVNFREDGKRRVYSYHLLLDNLNIDRISSGKGHSLILTSKGKLFAFGKNDFGQLGIGNKKNKIYPVEIETDNFWLNVSNYDIGCGYETSFLHYSLISNLNEDFKRIPVHDIILRYRIGSRNITNLKLLIQSKDEKEAKEILEMIYGNYDIDIDSKQEMKRYKFWKEGLK